MTDMMMMMMMMMMVMTTEELLTRMQYSERGHIRILQQTEQLGLL